MPTHLIPAAQPVRSQVGEVAQVAEVIAGWWLYLVGVGAIPKQGAVPKWPGRHADTVAGACARGIITTRLPLLYMHGSWAKQGRRPDEPLQCSVTAVSARMDDLLRDVPWQSHPRI